MSFVFKSTLILLFNSHFAIAHIYNDPSMAETIEKPGDGFSLLTDSNLSRQRAIAWAEAALKKAEGEDKDILSKELRKLQTVRINIPDSERDFIGCNSPTMLAFVLTNFPDDIYICAHSRDSSFGEELSLAQTILHETAHLIGFGDECSATRIEINIIWQAGFDLAYENGYMAGCGYKNKKSSL